MRDLTGGMHPGIGASGGGNQMRTRLQLVQRRLDRTLDRALRRLPLPARKRVAMIFDAKGVAGHDIGMSFGEKI